MILTGFTNTNTDNTTYDGIGRRFFVGVKIGFSIPLPDPGCTWRRGGIPSRRFLIRC